MEIVQNIELQPYNSFRTKAVAKLFCEPRTKEELLEVLQRYRNDKKLILGGGYNIFFTRDFDGIVIHPILKGIFVLRETNTDVSIEVAAGEDWDGFVRFCVECGFSGIENLSLIPGTVGAAPIQNIGAYGMEVKDVVETVNTIDMESGKQVEFDNASCQFGYRDSLFKQTRIYVVTSVVFRLNKSFVYREKYSDLNAELHNSTHPDLKQVREAVIRVRTRKLPDPTLLPNAGSFFKNPLFSFAQKEHLLSVLPDAPLFAHGSDTFKTSAAFLIEKAGLKGTREGNVGIYENHALIIVNYGSDDGAEIFSFMQKTRKIVSDKFGVMLEPEVWIF